MLDLVSLKGGCRKWQLFFYKRRKSLRGLVAFYSNIIIIFALCLKYYATIIIIAVGN